MPAGEQVLFWALTWQHRVHRYLASPYIFQPRLQLSYHEVCGQVSGSSFSVVHNSIMKKLSDK